MFNNTSTRNYEYRSYLPTYRVAGNIDEYVIPQCQAACRSFWSKNIFTTSCSNLHETRNLDGTIDLYIYVGKLSDENRRKFNELVESRPDNYHMDPHSQEYAITIKSTGDLQDLNSDIQALLSLTLPFRMQEVLEGYLSLEDYYTKYIALYEDPSSVKALTEDEVIAAIERHLKSAEEDSKETGVTPKKCLALLDKERKVVYDDPFYLKGHQEYLLKSQSLTSPDPHEL